MTETTISVSGVWLRRVGDNAVVAVEIDGRWRDVIIERSEGNFSHIVEVSGIAKATEAKL